METGTRLSSCQVISLVPLPFVLPFRSTSASSYRFSVFVASLMVLSFVAGGIAVATSLPRSLFFISDLPYLTK